jgi:membrane protein implicated in regulation of membrane protease activity
MDPPTIWLLISIIGIVLIVIEVILPGHTFMDVPGAVMLVLGMVGSTYGDWLMGELWRAPVVAAAVALPVSILSISIYRKLSKGNMQHVTTFGDSLVGRRGLVIVRVLPDSTRGKVKIGPRIWSATAEKDIPLGTRVRVKASEGVHIEVEPLPPGTGQP